jgi:hypothetical protein
VSIKELERLYPGYTKIRFKCPTGQGGANGRPEWMREINRQISARVNDNTGVRRRPLLRPYGPIQDLLLCLRLGIPFMSTSLRLEVSEDGIYGRLFVHSYYLLTIDLLWGVVTHFKIPEAERKIVKYSLLMLRTLGVLVVIDRLDSRRKGAGISILHYYISDEIEISCSRMEVGSECSVTSKIPYNHCYPQLSGEYKLESIRTYLVERLAHVKEHEGTMTGIYAHISIPGYPASLSTLEHIITHNPFQNVIGFNYGTR